MYKSKPELKKDVEVKSTKQPKRVQKQSGDEKFVSELKRRNKRK